MFHVLILGLLLNLPSGAAGRVAGAFWVVCDVAASVWILWNRSAPEQVQAAVFTPVRMAGHLFAAIWIISVSGA